MLKSNNQAFYLDPISEMIGKLNGNDFLPVEWEEGIILRPDFGGSHILPNYRDFIFDPEKILSISEYGVCDTHTQILEQCPELQDPNREFLIILTPVKKQNQSSEGGWRWHKWGPYIGDKKPQCEYLYDEPRIEEVFVYHIYEKQKEI